MSPREAKIQKIKELVNNPLPEFDESKSMRLLVNGKKHKYEILIDKEDEERMRKTGSYICMVSHAGHFAPHFCVKVGKNTSQSLRQFIAQTYEKTGFLRSLTFKDHPLDFRRCNIKNVSYKRQLSE